LHNKSHLNINKITLYSYKEAVLPQMIGRKQGKIVVYGSASALKGMKTLAAYSAARAAQLGYV
jgi:short-subunit dehydrogenase